MSLSTFILVLVTVGSAVAEFFVDPYALPIASIEDKIRLASWTEDDKQNIWELSGQFEGDIVLSPEQMNGAIDPEKKWLNNTILYKIDPRYNKDQVKQIHLAVTEFSNKTCIIARIAKDSDKDYVYISPAQQACYSRVGRQKGIQIMNLHPAPPGKGCFRLGVIIHEFMHALGFYHQQNDSERDNFVKIIWLNIIENKKHNFVKRCDVTSFGHRYDYESVMHYSAYAFSKNKKKTIVTTAIPDYPIGKRTGLSEIDVEKIKKMYSC